MPDYISYQKSISIELLSEKDRVRNFIDDRHWGEEGRYKEIILMDCIRRKLPSNVNVGTGFVIGDQNTISSQIDIIIYRSEIPTLFQKGDFVILTKESVLGIIEVKTKLCSENISDTFQKSHRNGMLIGNHIFNGIFSFEGGFRLGDQLANSIESCCKQYAGYINNVSFSSDYFMKYWMNGQPNRESRWKYRLYYLEDLSFGYFISNLLEDVFNQTQHEMIPDELNRLFYPIEETKEAMQKYTIFVDGENTQ